MKKIGGDGYMRKDLKENTKQNKSDKQFIHQVRILLKDWDIKVMSYVMLVIVMIAMIAATVAWFLYFKVVAVSNMGMTTADCEVLKVEVKQGTIKDENGMDTTNFVEVKEGKENDVLVDLDMPVFDNVETYEITVGEAGSGGSQNNESENAVETTKRVSKMAPGVYGSLTIRITPLSREINHYEIRPETIFNYVDSVNVVLEEGTPSVTQTDNNVKILQELAKGHILFFEKRVDRTKDAGGKLTTEVTIDGKSDQVDNYTHNQKYVFVNPISNDNPMTGELSWDNENNTGNSVPITIYWYWPYEYENLSSSIKQSIKLSTVGSLKTIVDDETSPKYKKLVKYFDIDKLKEIANDSISWNETQLYDYADTRIGTYVKSIKLHLEVKGYHAAEEPTQSEE